MGNLTLEGKPTTPEMRPYMYIRGALLNGLALEQKLGVNPFKIGMIGGTDVHNSLTSIEEDNFLASSRFRSRTPVAGPVSLSRGWVSRAKTGSTRLRDMRRCGQPRIREKLCGTP